MTILRWLLNALGLIIVSKLLSGFQVDSIWAAIFAAAILGIVNVLIRPILLLLTLPINFLTLGLFTFVINGLMLLLVAKIVRGFAIADLGTAIIAAILLWIISMILDALFVRPAQQQPQG
jgi:putative membrane protein